MIALIKKLFEPFRLKRAKKKIEEVDDICDNQYYTLYKNLLFENPIEIMSVPREERLQTTKINGQNKEVPIMTMHENKLMASIKTRIRWHVIKALKMESEIKKALALCCISYEKETFWMIEELSRRGTPLFDVLTMCHERFAYYLVEYQYGGKRYGQTQCKKKGGMPMT